MSASTLSTTRQRELLRELRELIDLRAREEVESKAGYEAREVSLRREYEAERTRQTDEYRQETDVLRTRYAEAMDDVMRQYDEQRTAAARSFEKRNAAVVQEAEQSLKAARRDRLLATQAATEQYDGEIHVPARELAELEGVCQQHQAELVALRGHAHGILGRRRCRGLIGRQANVEMADDQPRPLERYATDVVVARQKLHEMAAQRTAKFLEEGWPFLLLLLFWGLAVYPAGATLGWSGWQWIAASGAAGMLLTAAVSLAVYPVVRRQTAGVYPDFEHSVQGAERALQVALVQAAQETRRRQAAITARRDDALRQTEEKWSRLSSQIESDRQQRLREAAEKNDALKRQLLETRDRDLQRLNDLYPPQLDERERKFRSDIQQLESSHQQQLAENRQQFERRWSELVHRWSTGIGQFQQAVDQMTAYCQRHFPAWSELDWNAWTPPPAAVEALRLGSYRFDLRQVDHGIPADEDLRPTRECFDLPLVLSFPDCPSLLLKAADAGRDAAVRVLQNGMLRMLTSVPAGKVRFTIIDPTGLGQNFSAFMHLADYDDKLVTNRIWTEAGHINQRLLDLTEHMEKVIQKYLRNEFESIQQYNEHAGEVAEPFQILVIANFPAGFSDEAARRLVSIAASGARCGVYTLISTDQKLSLPRNFDLADLEARAATLDWREDRFVWQMPDLQPLPLTLDEPPADDLFTAAVKAAGRHAKDSSRVEVPFRTVAPDPAQWWTGDSRSEIDVPLGRAGATKLQTMRLGRGTSQHVLISGKTGSGKSTLLHALITNLALHYSPDEVEFYLIDFKKGVEFRPYAALGLPHARVIAIESEREFGMSVLERLDEELKRRGDLFRAQGVQNLAGYRDANPDRIMPRVLLIIDEFQELFVKDDRLAQDASLLLDRLVRQGRAFGIHVLLGSQTLAGAYSLARSTIGQMAVRVALQCSEADAHLILSEDNTAARLLSRPGEAIYNDANGLMEGNHPFQVVWLPDGEREYFLRELRSRAGEFSRHLPAPIVFEGNVPADPAQNELLRAMLQAAPEPSPAAVAWLGAAVAIKDPTAATFRRQSGSNLLLVGQQEELALGVLATSLVSLAAQMPSVDAARFYLFDGTHPDSPLADFWSRTAHRLPWDVSLANPRTAGEKLAEIAAELERRTQASDDSAPPVYLAIYNLGRFRDLKKGDDEFGFSMDENAAGSPGKQLTSILRDGPAYGIHTLVWCDTYNNVTRWFDRATLRDIEMRVLFQMGATDSSNLMDSPEASRLGLHRAILYSEELGQWEKFRPYGPPEGDWLGWVRRQLESRWLRAPAT
ncbi:MAG: AAA family ATPase [Pirellulaceae bacterium]|nr:AAA family ATPase [Pirellulaceae bacterium]